MNIFFIKILKLFLFIQFIGISMLFIINWEEVLIDLSRKPIQEGFYFTILFASIGILSLLNFFLIKNKKIISRLTLEDNLLNFETQKTQNNINTLGFLFIFQASLMLILGPYMIFTSTSLTPFGLFFIFYLVFISTLLIVYTVNLIKNNL